MLFLSVIRIELLLFSTSRPSSPGFAPAPRTLTIVPSLSGPPAVLRTRQGSFAQGHRDALFPPQGVNGIGYAIELLFHGERQGTESTERHRVEPDDAKMQHVRLSLARLFLLFYCTEYRGLQKTLQLQALGRQGQSASDRTLRAWVCSECALFVSASYTAYLLTCLVWQVGYPRLVPPPVLSLLIRQPSRLRPLVDTAAG
ncbi:hypothetical protein LZ30DRAFT_60904 [Colletotrichum cereale]|nr:hypothetical protein LZ30DRAFT_60904 [Colletotrichum cereale]